MEWKNKSIMISIYIGGMDMRAIIFEQINLDIRNSCSALVEVLN